VKEMGSVIFFFARRSSSITLPFKETERGRTDSRLACSEQLIWTIQPLRVPRISSGTVTRRPCSVGSTRTLSDTGSAAWRSRPSSFLVT
jgi:hypothetical protein